MTMYNCLKQLNVPVTFSFKERLVILSLIIVVAPLPPKIKIMTSGPKTVLWPIKEPGGTVPVIAPT